ncbi:hypothetical protein ACFS5M_12235 [Lacinutrix iliipiscaria]|uniref:Uncharacterized protein n=1 Tax=Lacinutrix iliipiscaria TaxID=1230532 RepID=A0ABW5WT38_9FLAO
MIRHLINRKILNLIFLFSTVLIFGQDYRLEDFETDSIPIRENLWKANHSKEDWVILKTNDSIKIKPNDYNYFKGDSLPFGQKEVAKKLNNQYSIRAVKKVEDGYIIGLNKGEFGGGLWFLSEDGNSSYEIMPYKRIHQILEFNKKLYVISGLAHMGSNYGNLLELKREENWRVSKTYKLPGAPNLMIREKENVLIITSEYLMSFNKYEKLIEILKAPFYWGVLYPSSAIIIDNHIYIAMRKGILKISDFYYNRNYEWYVKK